MCACPATASVISVKDQRIFELRLALSNALEEQRVLRQRLEEEGGQQKKGASDQVLTALQEELTSVRDHLSKVGVTGEG